MPIEFVVSVDLRADKKILSVVSKVATKDDEDGYSVACATSPNGETIYVDVGVTWAHDAISSGLRRFLQVVDHEYAHALSGFSKVSDEEEMMALRFERAGIWARPAYGKQDSECMGRGRTLARPKSEYTHTGLLWFVRTWFLGNPFCFRLRGSVVRQTDHIPVLVKDDDKVVLWFFPSRDGNAASIKRTSNWVLAPEYMVARSAADTAEVTISEFSVNEDILTIDSKS